MAGRNAIEVLIGTREGVVRTHTVWRLSEDERWDGALIKEMKGTPQKLDPNKSGVQAPIKVRFDGPKRQEPVETEPRVKEKASAG